MTAQPPAPLKLVYCYAREDKALRDELEKHLGALKRSKQITTWYDREIQPGMEWEHEIEAHLDTADIVLLLVSPDFLHSDYCWGKEMQHALERHAHGEARVMPVILRPIDYEGTPITTLQLLPPDGEPVTVWPSRDEAFRHVTKGIREVVEHLQRQQAVPQQETHPTLPIPHSRFSRGQLMRWTGVPLLVLLMAGALVLGSTGLFAVMPLHLTSTQLSPNQGSVLYQADWSEGMNGWKPPAGTLSSEWLTSGGMLLCNGAFNGGLGGPLFLVAPYEPLTINYAVVAHIQVVQLDPGISNVAFGILLREVPNGLGYIAGVGGDNYALENAFFEGIDAAVAEAPYQPGVAWHTYHVEARTNTIILSIDNTKIFTEKDSSNTFSSPGHVGLVCNGLHLQIKNFEVMSL